MTPGWAELTQPSGAALLDAISAEVRAGRSLDAIARSQRSAGADPALLAAALTQVELRERAMSKFGSAAAKLLFTRSALEQATRRQVADLHAARFTAAGCRVVADLGSGIGAESLALLRAGITPLAIELDPLTAAFAEHNLRVTAEASAASLPPAVTIGDAEAADIAAADGAFLDPARRTAGHSDTRRLTSPDDYTPSLSFAFAVGDRMPTGVKLGPGFDRDLIPDRAEAQWVSVDGQVVETGLWFGLLARAGVRRSALVMRGGETAELVGATDAEDAPVVHAGEVLYEPDGAVIRARLLGTLAADLGAGMLTEGIAYLTAPAYTPTPFAAAFRIREELPAREKDLRRALAARGIGSLEIKKRGANVDPATLRKRLKLSGDAHATLILTRTAGRHVAYLADRIGHDAEGGAPAR